MASLKQLTIGSALLAAALGSAVVGAQTIQTRDTFTPPPRPGGPGVMPTGTASIAGAIVSEETSPQPIRRAVVTVSGDNGFSRSTLTDDRGRFQIDGLPAARVNLSANKPGYVRSAYGAKRYDRPGTPITLADGQRVADITLRLARGSVISGLILDDSGMPAIGVGVRAMQYRLQPGGERALVLAPGGVGPGEMTDDRGMYRLYGLPAGEYVLVASPRLPEGGEVRAMTDAEIRGAMAAAQQPQGSAGARGVGLGTGAPPSQVAAPQAPADFATIGYSPVFYPGTTLAARATTLTVGAGEERTGVDFALSLVRTAKIEGTVIAPPGVPTQGVQLLLVSSGAAAMAGGDLINSARLGPDGKFTFTNIVPGQYTITARTGNRSTVMTFGPGGSTSSTMAFTTLATPGQPMPGRGGTGASANAGPGADPGPQYWGLTDVTVDGQNLSNVSVSLQPGMTLSGRIAVDALKMAVPVDLSRARITLAPVAAASGGMSIAFGGAQVDASGQFTITGLTPGKYRFTAAMPSDGALGSWQLKSAVAGGRDALDVPLDLGPGETISNAVVTFTDATQEVSGRLQDASGRPATDFTMVVFPADPRFWLAQSRRIKAVRPATDGRFVVTGLPPGEYRIAATLDVTQNEAADPALLEQLRQAAVPFTLAVGEKHVQDFKIGG